MPTIPVNPTFKQLSIKIEYEDQISIGGNGFNTLREMKMFLEDNPILFKALRTGELDNGITIDKNQDMDLETRI